MKIRRCTKCQMPLSYYNIGETCFRHYDWFTDWKVRRLRLNPHALTYPWDSDDECQNVWEAIMMSPNLSDSRKSIYPRR